MSKTKQGWATGDTFTVPQRDGVCSIGQVLGTIMKNVVSASFYDLRVPKDTSARVFDLSNARLVAILPVTREQLDFGTWRVIGHQEVAVPDELWPNEEYRKQLWVGAKIYDASIAEAQMDAYNGLLPWDDWHDPTYLDKLLVHPDRKPKYVVTISTKELWVLADTVKARIWSTMPPRRTMRAAASPRAAARY